MRISRSSKEWSSCSNEKWTTVDPQDADQPNHDQRPPR